MEAGGSRPTSTGARPPSAPVLILAVAMAAVAALLLALARELTFGGDDLLLLLNRLGNTAHTFLEPHNRQPVPSVILEYRFWQATVGMDSVLPYAAVSIAAFLASVAMVFLYARRCVGPWLALAAALAILLLGSASEDLLDPLQVAFFAPMACGIGALLALERESRPWDVAAYTLLVVAITFSGLGLAFVAGAAVSVAFGARPLGARPLVVLVPLALFAAWYLAYRDTASHFSLENLLTAPAYAFDGFAAAIASLLGLATTRNDAAIDALDWGRPLLLLCGLAAAIFAVRRDRMTPALLAVLAAAGTFWLTAAINADNGFRAAGSVRYRYVGAVFVVLIAAELLRGVRPSRGAIAAVFSVLAVAAASNLISLRDDFRFRHANTPIIRGSFTALDISRETVDPAFQLTDENSGYPFNSIFAGQYLAAASEYGTLGYPADELASAPEPGRAAADRVLVAAAGIGLEPAGRGSAASGCERVRFESGSAAVPVGAEGISIEATGGPVAVGVRRFAQEASVPLGSVSAGDRAQLAIPADGSDQAWIAELSGAGTAEVCDSASPGRD